MKGKTLTATLKAMSDDELSQHKADVLNEMERRANLRAIPAQVTQLASQFRAAGGDAGELVAALDE